MTIVGRCILGVAVLWTVLCLFAIRSKARNGQILILPSVSWTLVFALSILLTVTLRLSPFHLLWMFPVSAVVGIIVLVIPLTAKMVMYMVTLLAWPVGRDE